MDRSTSWVCPPSIPIYPWVCSLMNPGRGLLQNPYQNSPFNLILFHACLVVRNIEPVSVRRRVASRSSYGVESYTTGGGWGHVQQPFLPPSRFFFRFARQFAIVFIGQAVYVLGSNSMRSQLAVKFFGCSARSSLSYESATNCNAVVMWLHFFRAASFKAEISRLCWTKGALLLPGDSQK